MAVRHPFDYEALPEYLDAAMLAKLLGCGIGPAGRHIQAIVHRGATEIHKYEAMRHLFHDEFELYTNLIDLEAMKAKVRRPVAAAEAEAEPGPAREPLPYLVWDGKPVKPEDLAQRNGYTTVAALREKKSGVAAMWG